MEVITIAAVRNATKKKEPLTPLCRPDFRQWNGGWTTEFLKIQQEEDSDLLKVRRRLQHYSCAPARKLGRLESEELRVYWSIYETLANQGGVLYRRYHIQTTSQTVLQLLVPPALREMVLEKCHANLLSGHQGETNTFNALRRRFYWPTYRTDTKLFVQACE